MLCILSRRLETSVINHTKIESYKTSLSLLLIQVRKEQKMSKFESFVNFLRKKTTTPKTSFESIAIFAKEQREMQEAKKKKQLLATIEKAIKNHEFPELVRIEVGEDIPDSVLQELFDNRELMKELKVRLNCGCQKIKWRSENNNRHRIIKLSDLCPGYTIERRCDHCVKYNYHF